MPLGFFGGIYNNHLALEATLERVHALGIEGRTWCLGDIGGFGPHPDLALELLRASGVPVVQGNYDYALGHGLGDCGCGYTDPRDNRYAAISYRYTRERTHPRHLPWLRDLPPVLRVEAGGRAILLCHGSPRRTNEFLWESTSPDGFLEWLCTAHGCDVLVCTHTGIPWTRRLDCGRRVINCGAIGRPANNGKTEVAFALYDPETDDCTFVPVAYDHERLAAEVLAEGLPAEFAETLTSGWWTSCLEVLPARERAAGQF